MKMLVLVVSVLIGSNSYAVSDILCSSTGGNFKSAYLIIDQGISVPRDVEKRTQVTLVTDGHSEMFVTWELKWIAGGDYQTESAVAALSNSQSSADLVVGYSNPTWAPNVCKRCDPTIFSEKHWSATLKTNGKEIVFTCAPTTGGL